MFPLRPYYFFGFKSPLTAFVISISRLHLPQWTMHSLLIFHQRLSRIKLSLTSFLLIVSVIFSLSMNTLNADLDGLQPREGTHPQYFSMS